MKYIGQIIAAVIYTCLFTGVMYYAITIPVAFILALPWWGILLFILIGGGIIEGIIQMLCGFGAVPYAWITKQNNIATAISVLLVLFNVGVNLYRLWATLVGQGTWAIIFGVVATALLLQFVIMAIMGIMTARNMDS